MDTTQPSSSTPRTYDQVRSEVQDRFNHDFSYIPLPLLEKAYPDGQLLEHIIYPNDYDFEKEEEPLYPCWSTLFEARDKFLSEALEEKVNDLAEIGIHLMQVEETYVMMFICGAGYDFYEAHWIPLYRDILKWVEPSQI